MEREAKSNLIMRIPEITEDFITRCVNRIMESDITSSGAITKTDFYRQLDELTKEVGNVVISDSDRERLFHEYDKDGSGTLSREEVKIAVSDGLRRLRIKTSVH